MGLAERLGQVAGASAAQVAGVEANIEHRLGAREQFKRDVHGRLVERLGSQLYSADLDRAALQDAVFDVIQEAVKGDEESLSSTERSRLVQEIIDDILGLGPLEPLLRDSSITEIMVNGYDHVYVERRGRIEPTNVRFVNERHLREIIDRIVSRVGRRVDEASPMVDARLPDGSRVNAVIRPVAVDGSSLTIRKFAREIMGVEDLVALGTVTPKSLQFLRDCVVGRRNILISGGTGSGKTTTLNVLSSFIPEDQRIVTIEDAAELQLEQPHVVRLESR
ncbi:MAG: ATPase, T2SS/T4P/T4SS family, partial [Candidatus Nanopelagicales bacterium]